MADEQNRQLVENIVKTLRVAHGASARTLPENNEPLLTPPSRRDFGFAMLGLSIFTMLLAILLPPGNGVMFGFFAFVFMSIAAREIDRPKREYRKRRQQSGKAHQ